jgi:ankyrin repeat protein
VVAELLNWNANVNIPDSRLWTPLREAVEAMHGSASLKILEMLLKQDGVEINAQDQSQMTPVHLAANGQWVSRVKLLLQHSANVQSRAISSRLIQIIHVRDAFDFYNLHIQLLLSIMLRIPLGLYSRNRTRGPELTLYSQP